MESIIVSMITVTGTIIAAVIGYFAVAKKTTDIVKRLPEEHKNLSEEHKNLSAEQRNLSDGIIRKLERSDDLVSAGLSEVRRELGTVNEKLIAEMATSAERRAALRGKEKDISDAVCRLSDFSKIMQDLHMENERLVQENSRLRQENQKLNQALSRYRGHDLEL